MTNDYLPRITREPTEYKMKFFDSNFLRWWGINTGLEIAWTYSLSMNAYFIEKKEILSFGASLELEIGLREQNFFKAGIVLRNF